MRDLRSAWIDDRTARSKFVLPRQQFSWR